jgi:hypothetical protein
VNELFGGTSDWRVVSKVITLGSSTKAASGGRRTPTYFSSKMNYVEGLKCKRRSRQKRLLTLSV